jgi:AcrR family transcriptional regulator
MPRPSNATRQILAAETRQRLLEAAADEFAREGYVGANINRISRAAGFAKGTIYNYFPSKRALMLALVDEIAAVHVGFILQRFEPDKEPAQRLERFFSAGFAFVQAHPAQARVIINAIYGSDAEFSARVYEAYGSLFAMISQDIIEAGIARSDFRPVDLNLATALLMTIYLGSCSLLTPEGKVWIAPEQAASFVLEGLRRRE